MGFIKQQLKTIISAAGFSLLTGLAGMTGSAVASTPDGETPANEGVCDSLQGATPGLYGLCVAYCEAQDLDTIDKGPPNVRILENYNKKKQAGDPDMPCVSVPCPCWTDNQFANITDGARACFTGGSTITIADNDPDIAPRQASSDTVSRCTFTDFNVPVPDWPPLAPKLITLDITEQEAQSCHSQISNACPDP